MAGARLGLASLAARRRDILGVIAQAEEKLEAAAGSMKAFWQKQLDRALQQVAQMDAEEDAEAGVGKLATAEPSVAGSQAAATSAARSVAGSQAAATTAARSVAGSQAAAITAGAGAGASSSSISSASSYQGYGAD